MCPNLMFALMNAIEELRGDQDGRTAPGTADVRTLELPPSTVVTRIRMLLPRAFVKAILRPSGDPVRSGKSSFACTRRTRDPSASMTLRTPALTKAIRLPSGDHLKP